MDVSTQMVKEHLWGQAICLTAHFLQRVPNNLMSGFVGTKPKLPWDTGDTRNMRHTLKKSLGNVCCYPGWEGMCTTGSRATRVGLLKPTVDCIITYAYVPWTLDMERQDLLHVLKELSLAFFGSFIPPFWNWNAYSVLFYIWNMQLSFWY